MNSLPIVFIGDINLYAPGQLKDYIENAMLLTSKSFVSLFYSQCIENKTIVPNFRYDPLNMESREAAESVAILVTKLVIDHARKIIPHDEESFNTKRTLIRSIIPSTFSIESVNDTDIHTTMPSWVFFDAILFFAMSVSDPLKSLANVNTMEDVSTTMEMIGIRAIDSTKAYLKVSSKELNALCLNIIMKLDSKMTTDIVDYAVVANSAKAILNYNLNSNLLEQLFQELRKTNRTQSLKIVELERTISELKQAIFTKDNELKTLNAKIKSD